MMGNLDPTAEEFRPTNPNHRAPPPHPQLPYVFPFVPTPLVQLQMGAFFDHTTVGVPPCPQFPAPTALSTSPTRSLLLNLLPSETVVVSESTLIKELEAFGDVRRVQMEGLFQGMVMATAHFYDLRHAEAAFTAIRWQRMQHHTTLRYHHYQYYALMAPTTAARGLVWAQYIVPAACDDGQNQGTIVVFNLDSKVEAHSIREIFEAFGAVKELRHTPFKKSQRFVEYFDIRDAARALKQMNGKEIHGRHVVIEFSRPGRGQYCRNSFKSPPPHKLCPHRFAPDHDHDDDATSPLHYSDHMMESSVSKGSGYHHDKATQAAAAAAALALVNLGDQERGSSQGRNSIGGTNTSTQQQQQPARTRNWNKGKHAAAKKHEARFLIKEQDATVLDSTNSCIDSRTTVMIKNIPNKYSQKLVLNMLDTHCNHCNEQIEKGNDQPLSSYDFVYLPIDFNNKCNVGYGFVNMTSPEATLRLYKAFHHQHWEVFNSRKICEVTYARVQGLEALKEHFKNSKFPYEMEQYCLLPVVFSPPRDGKQLTEPLAIVGSDRDHHHDDLLSSSRSSQNGGVEADDDDDHSTGTTSFYCTSDELSGSNE